MDILLGLTNPQRDDIILLRKVHQKYPKEIGFCFHSKAIIETRFPKDFSSFWNQRRRWVSKSLSMPSKQITAVILLMFFYSSLHDSITWSYGICHLSKQYQAALVIMFRNILKDIH